MAVDPASIPLNPPARLLSALLKEIVSRMKIGRPRARRARGRLDYNGGDAQPPRGAEGRGVCGTYTRDIAMTKAAQAESLARGNEHPLRCTVEPE